MSTRAAQRIHATAPDSAADGSGIIDRIGNTPLVELRRIPAPDSPVRILAKLEWYNPGGSVKDRAALNMVREGERAGQLTRDKIILDATSGNTGIGYAMVGAALGYRVRLAIPLNVGEVHKRILQSYGAGLVYTDPQRGSDGAIEKARELFALNPEQYFYPDQYNNPANWQAHYHGTAAEIIRQTGGDFTHFVAGLGTSGTFMGIARRLREYNRAIKLISVQPVSPMHGLEGMKHIPTSIVPGIYDESVADENIWVQTEDAFAMIRQVARQEGMLIGPSAGAVLSVAATLARDLTSGRIVVILPDGAHKYIGQPYWGEIANGHPAN
jgi:cysteine synthase B